MTQQQIFRASEILDMAVQIEKQGLAFYTACARMPWSEQIDNVFQFLIDQEHKHVDIFTSMKEGLEDYRLPETYQDEARSYVQSFVKGRVFTGPQQARESAESLQSPLEAIDLALQFEWNSINFYSGIKDMVRESDHEAVDRIIAEEHNHVGRLRELRSRLEE